MSHFQHATCDMPMVRASAAGFVSTRTTGLDIIYPLIYDPAMDAVKPTNSVRFGDHEGERTA